jgi:hypothetical protein
MPQLSEVHQTELADHIHMAVDVYAADYGLMLHADAITSDSDPEHTESDYEGPMHPTRDRNLAARRSEEPGAAGVDQPGIGQPDAIQPDQQLSDLEESEHEDPKQPAETEQTEDALALLRIDLNLDHELGTFENLFSIARAAYDHYRYGAEIRRGGEGHRRDQPGLYRHLLYACRSGRSNCQAEMCHAGGG